MTLACRNAHYGNILCKYGVLIKKLSDSLAYQKRDLDCITLKAKLISMYLEAIKCYIPFTSQVYSSFTITATKTTGTDTVALIIDGVTIATYTGSGTSEDMLSYFYNYILENSTVYETFLAGTTLYVWSYDSSTSDSDVVSYTSLNSLSTISGSSLNGENDEILNAMNCITEDQLQKIIDHSYHLLQTTSTTNCGC